MGPIAVEFKVRVKYSPRWLGRPKTYNGGGRRAKALAKVLRGTVGAPQGQSFQDTCPNESQQLRHDLYFGALGAPF
jgi:hypothetical protein